MEGDTEYEYDEDDNDSVKVRKDRNHLWVLHGLYFISFVCAFLSLIFVQKFNDKGKNETMKKDSSQSQTQKIGNAFLHNIRCVCKQLKNDIMSLRN